MVDSRSWMVRSQSSLGFAKEGRSRERTVNAREQPRSCPNGTSNQSPGLRSYPGLPPRNLPYAKGIASGRAPSPWQAAPVRKPYELEAPFRPCPLPPKPLPIPPDIRPAASPGQPDLAPARSPHASPPLTPCQINDSPPNLPQRRKVDIALRLATNKSCSTKK